VDNNTGQVWADREHALALLRYETFSTADYERFWQQYIRHRDKVNIEVWARPDNTKPGLQVQTHQTWYPTVQNIYQRSISGTLQVLVEATFTDESQGIGAPQSVYVEYSVKGGGDFDVNLQWFGKPACRLPEAFWLTFCPIVVDSGTWSIHKLGQAINPLNVVSNGARTLHAFQRGVVYQDSRAHFRIDSLDAALVAPGKPSLLDFHNQLPDMTGGMHFNLFNNVWGTNFPMWFEDDARFRFSMTLQAT
jgi:hypothetical protein